ncbi:hypothetical protein CBR_g9004 [Chara braunii]|uniref:Uncharacterized protein n=1 Tax=Chara braunii TaxID=69332 RepID=A0A388KNK4_CHABU|nr:hypothetical protein CBR_g9004 [Chara braunii]|eukprot:GBG71588.1 hypothetical protein CBR_g9004 [Chara braunii]
MMFPSEREEEVPVAWRLHGTRQEESRPLCLLEEPVVPRCRCASLATALALSCAGGDTEEEEDQGRRPGLGRGAPEPPPSTAVVLKMTMSDRLVVERDGAFVANMSALDRRMLNITIGTAAIQRGRFQHYESDRHRIEHDGRVGGCHLGRVRHDDNDRHRVEYDDGVVFNTWCTCPRSTVIILNTTCGRVRHEDSDRHRLNTTAGSGGATMVVFDTMTATTIGLNTTVGSGSKLRQEQRSVAEVREASKAGGVWTRTSEARAERNGDLARTSEVRAASERSFEHPHRRQQRRPGRTVNCREAITCCHVASPPMQRPPSSRTRRGHCRVELDEGIVESNSTMARGHRRVGHDNGPGSSSSRTRQWPVVIVESNSTIARGHRRVELDNGLGSSSSRTRQWPVVIVESNSTLARGHRRVGLDNGLWSLSSLTRERIGVIVEMKSTMAWDHRRVGLDNGQAAAIESNSTAGQYGVVESNTTAAKRQSLRPLSNSAALQNMEGEGKASKRRASKNSGSMEQSPKKLKGTPAAGVGSQEAPGSKRQRTPVPRGAPSTSTPSTRVRGSGPDKAVLMTGGPARQERVPGPQQGRSVVEVVPGRPSITIRDTPPGPKAGQIGEKGPCRGLVVPSAPMKTRPTATKAPLALGSRSRYDVATKGHLPLVGQQRYDYTVSSRTEEAHEYFEDEDEENSEEYSERAGGQEQYAAGVGGMTRHPGETSKVVGQDEDSEHTMSELGGEVGLAGGYGSSYEGCEGDVHATVAVAGHTNAAGLAERKRKHRQERKSLIDSKRSRQEAGEKRQLKVMPVDKAVQRTRETEAAAKKKQQPKKRKAKGGVMEKTSVFLAEQPQSDEEAKGKTTRPPSLRNVPSVTSFGVLSKGFFLELDKRGNQCPDMEFVSVQFDRILDIPDGEFRYNQRYLVQQTVDDIYDAMVASGEAALRERMTGAAGVNVCTLYEKPVLLLVALRDTLHTDTSGRIVRARRMLPDDFDLESVNKYYYYPLSGQHNVAAARRCFVERPYIAQELRLDRWTARPVYYLDKSMDNYGTLSTFQNAKDKWNTPPHQIVVIQNIRKLWHESNCPEAKGGSAAEVKMQNKMIVIMYSNDGDYHRNTIPLLEDIPTSTPAADRLSGEQAGDLSTLVRRERRPKMLADVVEKNFTPTKLKMAGMEPREKFAYEGIEREPNAMVETLEHFCLADKAVVFVGNGHVALIWELLKSHRHCIVLEGEGMKFEFLVQFVTKMVKSGFYFANFVKPPPRHDEKRDLVYRVGQNIINIWEFLFETKPQNRGEHAYVVRRRKMKSLLRGYYKAPAKTEVAFLDRLEMMYFDEQIGAFTISAYATCFGEGFDAEDSEEESEDGTLQAALADERQKVCSSASQKMGAPGTSSGSGGASSMAVTTDQFQRTSYMAGNTTALSSGAVMDDPRVQAILSPEVMASLSALAHSPTTVLELLCYQTPQPPPSEPLEYEIEDIIPPDIAWLPGPIVGRDDYTVMPDNVWGHHIIWHPHHFQPALARGNWVMAIKEEGEWQFCLHRRMSRSKFVTHAKNEIGKRLLRLNPKVSQSRLDARIDEIFQEFETSRWLEYLEEFYDRETSPTFGYYWRIEEELEDKVGERKGASGDESGKGSRSGGGALGKGTRSSGGEHGKGSEPRGGASGKGLGPDVGASGKPISHGELQKHKCVKGVKQQRERYQDQAEVHMPRIGFAFGIRTKQRCILQGIGFASGIRTKRRCTW